MAAAARLSPWRRFIHPPKIQRGEPSALNNARVAGAILFGAAVTAPVETVGNTAAVVLRLPNAVTEAYRTTWATPNVGPNIKVLTSVLILPAAVAAVPLAVVASALWGLGFGGYAGAEYGALNAVKPAFGHVEWVWKHGDSGVLADFTKELRAPLEEGKEPFDIRILEAFRGLAGAVASVAIEVPLVSAMAVFRTPRAFVRVWTDLVPEIAKESGIVGGAVGILATAAVPVAAALFPVGAVIWGLGEGAVEGYQRGIAAAVGKAMSRVGDAWKWSGKLVSPGWNR